MFMSFVTGIVFGLGSKYVTGPISEFVSSKVALSEREMAIVTFGLVMLAASVVAAIFTGTPNAFWLILGGTIGVFGLQLFAFAKAQVDGKAGQIKDKSEEIVEDATEAVEDAVETVEDTAKEGLEKL